MAPNCRNPKYHLQWVIDSEPRMYFNYPIMSLERAMNTLSCVKISFRRSFTISRKMGLNNVEQKAKT